VPVFRDLKAKKELTRQRGEKRTVQAEKTSNSRVCGRRNVGKHEGQK